MHWFIYNMKSDFKAFVFAYTKLILFPLNTQDSLYFTSISEGNF